MTNEEWEAVLNDKVDDLMEEITALRAENERLARELSIYHSTLSFLHEAYRNKHSPQHRQTVMTEAATVLSGKYAASKQEKMDDK